MPGASLLALHLPHAHRTAMSAPPDRIETERLWMRPTRAADAKATHYWQVDPEVVRFLGGIQHPTVESFRAFLERVEVKYDAYAAAGLPWVALVVFEKGVERPIGTALCKPAPEGEGDGRRDSEEIEIGWHLARQAWGRGFATELGRAMRDRAFELGGVPHVNAFVDRENTASARVAERCGLRRVEPSPRFYGGADRYRMTRAEWEARGGSGSG